MPFFLFARHGLSYDQRLVGIARLEILENARAHDRLATMAAEVRAGLGNGARRIPPKYFYDDAGCRLFDAICDLDEYYLTRTERALLERHARAIVSSIGPPNATALVEIGSGLARKTGILVGALCARGGSPSYVPFDIAPSAIELSAESLLPEHPSLSVRGVVGDFAHDLGRIALVAPPSAGPRLFAFLGSTIGNLDEHEAPSLLRDISRLMTGRDRFLLGVDLVKDPRVLVAAYDDALGVTAEFNRNVLRVLSRELDGDFDPSAFDHSAIYDDARQRIEMRLVSKRRQSAHLRAIDLSLELERGESILTEISRKFTRATVERTLFQGAMRLVDWLSDADGQFALVVAAKA
ncbi:MAG TPA: L-histidine N(alpha)-methyltransferase [Polyangiaceae bacterium]